MCIRDRARTQGFFLGGLFAPQFASRRARPTSRKDVRRRAARGRRRPDKGPRLRGQFWKFRPDGGNLGFWVDALDSFERYSPALDRHRDLMRARGIEVLDSSIDEKLMDGFEAGLQPLASKTFNYIYGCTVLKGDDMLRFHRMEADPKLREIIFVTARKSNTLGAADLCSDDNGENHQG